VSDNRPIGDRRAFDRLPGGGYAYTLIDDLVRVEVRYLRWEFRQLHAEVDVLCDHRFGEMPGIRSFLPTEPVLLQLCVSRSQ
jgi:hypothetical protein